MTDLPNMDNFQACLDEEALKRTSPVNEEDRTVRLTRVEELPIDNDSMNFENPVVELFEELDERLS